MAEFQNASAVQMQSAGAGSGDASRSSGATWRRGVALFGIAALLLETIVALVQAPRAEPLRTSPTMSLAWWRYPVERNAIERMPVSRAPLYAVAALRGTDEVWFAGAGGLIVHSRDGGRTWDSTNVRAVPQGTAQPASPAPTPAQNAAPRRAASARTKASARERGRATFASFTQAKANSRIRPVRPQSPVPQPYDQKSDASQSPRIVVPDVLGLGADPAEKRLLSSGLHALRTFATVRDSAQNGVVLAQYPAAGVTVPTGTAVNLRIGRYTSTTTPATIDSARSARDSATGSAAQRAADATTFYPRLDGICITTSGMGWAVGERGAAFRSVDRGATWTQLATNVADDLATLACDATLGAVAGSTSTVLWLRPDRQGTVSLRSRGTTVGSELAIGAGDTLWMGGDGAAVRFSADTARSWRTPTRAPYAIAFAGASTRFAVDSTGLVSASEDGGRTWSARAACHRDSTSSSSAGAHTIVPASATTALMVDALGHLSRTTDGWRHCDRVLDLDGRVHRVAGVDESVWYAVSDGAFRSDDGGRSWHSLINTGRFASLLFRDSLHGVAGVENGLVGRTTDGGRSWTVHRLDAQHTAAPTQLVQRTATELLALDHDDHHFLSRDGGDSWQPLAAGDSVIPLVFTTEQTGWGITGDTTWTTHDGGTTWDRAPLPEPLRVVVRQFADDSRNQQPERLGILHDARGDIAQLWLTTSDRKVVRYAGARWDTLAAGVVAASPATSSLVYGLDTLGALVRSTDGGRSWAAVDAAPPRKYPAPWYYALAMLTVAGTLATARARTAAEQSSEESIADILVSDRPLREGDRDVLDFGKIAAGLSRFIRNTRTEPPLTIAVTGPWGTGKSSLMNLLRRDLQRRGFRTIWFNAWHHQREESLLASLLEAVRLTATPPVWSPRGARFRLRLLARRFHRYRGTLVLLPVFAFAVGYILANPSARWHDLGAGLDAILRYFGSSTTPPAAGAPAARDAAAGASRTTFAALLISIVGTIFTYLKGLKAFGVKPGEVAKSVVSAGRVRTIESQPAFRYRFAQDFSEVTEALKPERIVIFIDDLDRCKPEQVLEILEAINFLAESGDCVIVLGIDRERVTGCVAIGFKDVATVLASASAKPAESAVPKPDIGAPVAPTKTNLDYQIEYAQHYLEKLLNMEVPIPPATAEGLGDVMTSSGEPADERDAQSPETVEELRDRARRRRRGRLYASVVVAATVACFVWGLNGAGRRPSPAELPTSTAVVRQAGDTVRDTAVVQAPATQRDVAARVPADTSSREPMVLVAGVVPSTAWWVHVPLALLAIGVLLWLLTPREDNRVEDSAAFATALKAWAPVLFEEHPTPRSAKKFLNKMRFLSMAQRAPAPRRAPVETLLDRLRTLPMIGRMFGATAEEEQPDELLPDAIPEVTLVSLNVIRDRYPEWLADPAFWVRDLQDYVKTRVDPVPMEVAEALRSLGQIQSRLAMGHHRDAWRRLELWVRDG